MDKRKKIMFMMVICLCLLSSSGAVAMMMGGEKKSVVATKAATPSMLKCLDTRKRGEKKWTQHPRAVHTEAEARALCAGKKYMSLECPTKDGYEVWCADDISDMPVLADAECMGTTSDTSINNGKNGACDAGGGTYLTTDGLNMGGHHRGSLYAI
jgi:hypothetical protein